MGLLANLRVLCTSDIGSRVRELSADVMRIEGDLDEIRDLSERRFRRLRKRQSDEVGETNGSDTGRVSESPAVARAIARRSARAGGSGGGG